MLPETIHQKPFGQSTSEELEAVETLLSKSDFDEMMEFIQNPPELPEYLLEIASWYNDATK